MRVVNLVCIGEILQFAEDHGIAEWNEAMDKLESVYQECYESYADLDIMAFTGPADPEDVDDHPDSCREIMRAFFKHLDVETFVLVHN